MLQLPHLLEFHEQKEGGKNNDHYSQPSALGVVLYSQKVVNLYIWHILAEVIKTYCHIAQERKHNSEHDLVGVVRLSK
jgi:hypothetical protein